MKDTVLEAPENFFYERKEAIKRLRSEKRKLEYFYNNILSDAENRFSQEDRSRVFKTYKNHYLVGQMVIGLINLTLGMAEYDINSAEFDYRFLNCRREAWLIFSAIKELFENNAREEKTRFTAISRGDAFSRDQFYNRKVFRTYLLFFKKDFIERSSNNTVFAPSQQYSELG